MTEKQTPNTQTPSAVSKWEIAGVPVAVIGVALNNVGFFKRLGFAAEDVPDLILLTFVAVALIRVVIDNRRGAAAAKG